MARVDGLTARGREMAGLIAELERSGQTMQEFAAAHRMAAPTFAWWGSQLKVVEKATRRLKPLRARLNQLAAMICTNVSRNTCHNSRLPYWHTGAFHRPDRATRRWWRTFRDALLLGAPLQSSHTRERIQRKAPNREGWGSI